MRMLPPLPPWGVTLVALVSFGFSLAAFSMALVALLGVVHR
jgi:hypothetical protein